MVATSFTTLILTVLSLLCLVTSAPISGRDVFVPPVLYPGKGTVWKAGDRHNVTWDVSNPPAQITNKLGRVVLSRAGILIGLENPLADKFDIMLGRIEVTVPADTEPGTDYSIVLFGDSGNSGKNFTITN